MQVEQFANPLPEGGAAFARQLPRLRQLAAPIYAERGILPEIAAGLSDAAALDDEAER